MLIIMKNKTNKVALIFLATLLLACKKEVKPVFPWVKAGNTLYYNSYSSTDTIVNALTLSIITNPGSSSILRFNYKYDNSINSNLYFGTSGNIYVNEDGLNARAELTCSYLSGTSKEYIIAPQKPIVNTIYPLYKCGWKFESFKKVIQSTHPIAVKGGVFNCYILEDTTARRKEYWDVENGLIVVEQFNKNKELEIRYELSSKNY